MALWSVSNKQSADCYIVNQLSFGGSRMILEYAITMVDPKSVNLLFTASTTKGQFTKSDVMAALGILQSRCPFGLSLTLAKYQKDKSSRERALSILKQECNASIPYYVRKKSAKKLNIVIHTLCNLVINDYSRTADTVILPCRCRGRGLVNGNVCSRCNGNGIRKISSAKIYNLMIRILDIEKTAWVRYWKPFYDELIAKCEVAESEAAKEFKKITD